MLAADNKSHSDSFDDRSIKSINKDVAELNKYNQIFEEVVETSQEVDSVSNETDELEIDSHGKSSDSYDDVSPHNKDLKVNTLMKDRSRNERPEPYLQPYKNKSSSNQHTKESDDKALKSGESEVHDLFDSNANDFGASKLYNIPEPSLKK